MRSPRRPSLLIAGTAVAGLLALGILPARAEPSGGDTVFASFDSASTGELDGKPFTVTGCEEPTVSTSDLSGAAFVPAGSASQPVLTCTSPWSLQIDFDAAVSGLGVYLVGVPDGECVASTYTFLGEGIEDVAVASGLADATVSGSTLTVPFESPNSGVVALTGDLTSLTITSEARAGLTGSFTLATSHVEPPATTTTSSAPTTTTAPTVPSGPGVAGDAAAGTGAGGAGGAGTVTPSFIC